MNNIKLYRIQKNITQVELANKTQLSIGYICHLEKGTRSNPSVNVMKDIAKALNEPVYNIFIF